MAKFSPGDIVEFNFDDGEPPGLAKVRVLELTEEFITGQLYRIEILEIIQPSSWDPPTASPEVESMREVVEGHLSLIGSSEAALAPPTA